MSDKMVFNCNNPRCDESEAIHQHTARFEPLDANKVQAGNLDPSQDIREADDE